MNETMASIAAEVAAKHGLTVAQLKSQRRSRPIAWPRQEAFARCIDIGKSTTLIGKFFGGRDHTTVIFGARRHRARQAGE